MSLIQLPVSIGEAFDKLSILEIKKNKIKDDRKIDVVEEYNLIYQSIEKHLTSHDKLYSLILKVNNIIWDQMDILRENTGTMSDVSYGVFCKECIEMNDIRFRIKRKINDASKSKLKEQKSYKINTICVRIDCSDDSCENFTNLIHYLSLVFDNVVIICSNDNLKSYFAYDSHIIFATKPINDDINQIIFNKYRYSKDQIKETIKNNKTIGHYDKLLNIL